MVITVRDTGYIGHVEKTCFSETGYSDNLGKAFFDLHALLPVTDRNGMKNEITYQP